jgi:hypothetical protein
MGNEKSIVPYELSLVEYSFLEHVDPKDYIVAYRFNLRKGWLIVVIKQIYNYRVAVSKRDLRFYDDMWCYEHIVDACLAICLWDPMIMPEPEGWIRNPYTGRRRSYDEEGEMIREWIDP